MRLVLSVQKIFPGSVFLFLACWGLGSLFLPCVTAELNGQQRQAAVPKFAEDVLVHVVLHELGHAVVREFDLPILGNEETMADAFATSQVITRLPDRALDVITARVESLMIEAEEVPRDQWTVKGEHNNDARRAYQIAALAVAADADKFRPIAKQLGMDDAEIAKASDYGAEIHRSWRRQLQPIMMPAGMDSSEVRVRLDPSSKLAASLQSGQLIADIESVMRRIDWHSQVTIAFTQGDGGAGWSRSKRTISVPSGYVRRFINQSQIQKNRAESK